MPELFTTLIWLSVTVVTFWAMDRMVQRVGRPPLLHPVLLSTPVIIAALMASRTSYETYSSATGMITFLLGPTVVSMAVPIWANRRTIRRLALPISLALLAGALTAIITSVGIVWLFGAPQEILASVAPRATTTPVGMAISQTLGGIPALTAVIVIFAGVFGAMLATPVLNLIRVHDWRARGFAVGVSAHGAGAARAFEVSPTAGAYAGVGMALNAVLTATLLSILSLLL
ncbi:LrgB family protein [Brevundimonas pishanensis]|uniref:LrgB family protein n=1 Tax=Brevundimonas pishanensis TaxID=2896315 RepID=UPI001FA75F9E|nr:LrgB family protein [Brevundimonas pishanensis]